MSLRQQLAAGKFISAPGVFDHLSLLLANRIGFDAAGISAIQIEDQEFPKKCGHTPHRRVIPTEQMCTHIQVAVEARQSEDFLIIARTDARTGLGLAEAIDRMAAYADAGSDVLFLESPQSKEAMAAFCRAIDKPCLANLSNGGYTPMLDTDRLRELGYAMAIFPALAPLAALAAMEQAYQQLKTSGSGTPTNQPL